MNFTKSIVALGIVSTLFFSCKDTASKPAFNNTNDAVSSEKKVTEVATKPQTASFKIEGMTCSMGCAKTIEKQLANTNGVQKATVDFDKKEAIVQFDADVITQEKLFATVEATGDGATYKVIAEK